MRLKPQPATVIASVALFVALGGTSYAVTGGTSFAAKQINGSQLANHSIAGFKLEDHTVTGQQVDVAGFPTVPSAVFAGQASIASTAKNAVNATNAKTAGSATTAGTITGTISGSQVSSAVANATNAVNATNATKATTAGTITGTISGSQVSSAVANATNSITAATATNATNATNATHIDGDQVVNISDWSSSTSDATLAGNIAGLTLAMRCTGGDVDIDATTSVSSASYGMSAVANAVATSFVKAEGTFNTGNTITSTIAAPSQLSFSYEQNGLVASGTLTVFDDAGICAAFGVAEYSG